MLSEDLYRGELSNGRKPIIKQPSNLTETGDLAWDRFLYRNQSIISDLFYGMQKSTLECSKCDKVAVTYDPMSSLILPIPVDRLKQELYFVPKDFKPD